MVIHLGDLKTEINDIYDKGKEIRSHLKQLRKRALDFLSAISGWSAKNKKESGSISEYQLAFTENSFETLVEVPAFDTSLDELKEMIYHLKQAISSSYQSENDFGLLKEEVLACSDRTSQLLADLRYLVAAKTEEHAFWIEGNFEKGWTKLCGVPLDVASLLSGIWQGIEGSVIFTSATLSVTNSMDYFIDSAGLTPHKARTAIGMYPSPFSSKQSLRCVIKSAPEIDTRDFPRYVANTIKELHAKFEKNILVLFTANSMLSAVNTLLKADSSIEKGKLLAQGIGSGARHTLLEQFKQNQRMILLGTESFWEGIDAPGEACEFVIIPRLPFPVPSHPLYQAISKKMDALHGESFMSYAVPEAVIRFRQGAGRLIRTATDRGALLVLDTRIITKGYGKQFVRSLDGEFVTYEDVPTMIAQLTDFFNGTESNSPVSYVPFDDV